jgi:hypothetical protein
LGGSSNDEGNTLAAEASEDILISGTFEGTADFNPGHGVHNLISSEFRDMFFAKLKPGGAFRNARGAGAGGNDHADAIVFHRSGNFFTAGRFNATVDLDPGSGVANHSFPGDFDLFILKL